MCPLPVIDPRCSEAHEPRGYPCWEMGELGHSGYGGVHKLTAIAIWESKTDRLLLEDLVELTAVLRGLYAESARVKTVSTPYPMTTAVICATSSLTLPGA